MNNIIDNYVFNREPLAASPFSVLPLGSIRPKSWLESQLRLLSWGITGHLDEIWPDVGSDSGWLGGAGDSWERGPYYCDGLIPLAYILNDEALIKKANRWIEWSIQSQTPDGNFGPQSNSDWWPRFVMLKVLISYYSATDDSRVIRLMQDYFKYQLRTLPENPLTSWAEARAGDLLYSIYWLYNRTGDEYLLDLADLVYKQTLNWTELLTVLPYKELVTTFDHRTHVVNIAMAVKQPGMRYLQTKLPEHRDAVYKGIEQLMKYHGQAYGMWSGDEWLATTNPSHGVETCAIVEYMFSLESLVSCLGDVSFADILEKVAFNALPASMTPDTWGHQFDQQANQVLCSLDERHWECNDSTSNLFGFEPNFGCCTANLHQGWPKYVSSLWLATVDRGLACISYAPCEVKAFVGNQIPVSIDVSGDYPFKETVSIKVETSKSASFPLLLRIPDWCDGFAVRINGVEAEFIKEAGMAKIDRIWEGCVHIDISLKMNIKLSRRYNDAVAVERGPLVYSLRIGEAWNKVISGKGPSVEPCPDWEVRPTTPWNYGLVLGQADDGADILPSVKVRVSEKLAFQPFDSVHAPVNMVVKAKRIPEWQLVQNSADAPPKSPVRSNEPVEDVELIPYGCARLRVTEFPAVK